MTKKKFSLKKSLASAALAGALTFLPSCDDVSPQRNHIENQENRLNLYAQYIAPHEGRMPWVYCARNPRETDRSRFEEPTIGVGHFMDRGNSRETFSRILQNVNWEDVYLGRTRLTNNQIDTLFTEDLSSYVDRTRGLFPNFENYPVYLQQALVDGVYRGDLSGSPRTRALINRERFQEAATEYLNHAEYRNARASGMSGVATRMERNRDAMLRYHNESRRN